MKDRIIFLDYDGVVNNALWHKNNKGELDCFYNFPEDNAVNNYQAICWLNHLYEQYPYDIVVCSSWREDSNYKECLYNAGLNKEIEIIGCTDIIEGKRELEIYTWINDNNFKGNFAILDDDEYYYGKHIYSLKDHLVLCNQYYGFLEPEYNQARKLLAKRINKDDNIKHYHHHIDTPYEIITEYEVLEELDEYKKVKYTCPYCKKILDENIDNNSLKKSIRCPSCKTYICLMDKGEIEKRNRESFEKLLEKKMPEYLKKSIREDVEAIKYRNTDDWDCCYCDLQASINIAENNKEITSEEAWYLREKYLGLIKEDNT